MKKVIVVVLSIFFSVLMVGMASALTFELNVGSTLPSIDYGDVTLTLTGGDILVQVDLTDSGAKIVNTGFAASFAFNQAGTTDPQIGVTGLPVTYSLVNSGNKFDIGMDGFGTFEYGVFFNTQGGGAGTDSTLDFTVTKVGGFTTVEQLVENSTNPPGSISSPFAVDVIYQGATGVIGTTTTAVPEPATLLLLGCGLLGVVGFRRFKK